MAVDAILDQNCFDLLLKNIEAAGHPLGMVGRQIIRRNGGSKNKAKQAKGQAN
jgi:hypothetical protein